MGPVIDLYLHTISCTVDHKCSAFDKSVISAYFDLALCDLDLDLVTLTYIMCCPLHTSITLWNNHLNIYLYTWIMDQNEKFTISWPLTFKMYRVTSKSIGFVLDPYPTKVPSTNPLGQTMSEKSGRQTDTQTDTHTDGTNHSIVAHFVRGNYKIWATDTQTHTHRQTDRQPGIFGPERSQYIQSMKWLNVITIRSADRI